MAKKHIKLSDQIRRAIDASGFSRYFICKTLDMSEATMSRFMSGKGGLSLDKLDELADLLNLDITAGKPRSAKKENKQ